MFVVRERGGSEMFGAILKEKLDWTKFEVPWPSKFLETLNSDFTHEIGIIISCE